MSDLGPLVAAVTSIWLPQLAMACACLLLAWACGCGVALRLAPQQRRFTILFGTAVGVLLIGYLAALGSWLGVPIGRSAYPIVAFLTGCSVALLWRRRRQLLLEQWRAATSEGLLLIALTAAALAILGRYQLQGGVGGARDFFGSGDFLIYADYVDYLVRVPARLDSYLGQERIRSATIEEQLVLWARLGSVGYAAVLGRVLSPRALQATFLPLCGLAAGMMAALCRPLLGLGWRTVAVAAVIVLHPMLGFLGYFSYVPQAVTVSALLTTLMLLEPWFDSSQPPGLATSATVALLTAAALTFYPVSAHIIATFFAVSVARLLWRRELRAVGERLLVGLGAALLASFYLPRVYAELHFAATARTPMGWDWESPVAVAELLGFRPVAGGPFPQLLLRDRIGPELLLGGLVAGLLALGPRLLGRRSFATSLLVASAGLIATTLPAVVAGRPTATHALAKSMSQTAPLVAALALGAALALFDRLGRRWASLLAFALLLFCGTFARRASLLGGGEPLWYGDDLAVLVHRLPAQSPLVLLPGSYFSAPVYATALIDHEESRVEFSEAGLATAGFLPAELTFVSHDSDGKSGRERHRQGAYWAGRPPQMLSAQLPPPSSPLRMHHHGLTAWTLEGRNTLGPAPEHQLTLILDEPTPTTTLSLSVHSPPHSLGGTLTIQLNNALLAELPTGLQSVEHWTLPLPAAAKPPGPPFATLRLTFTPTTPQTTLTLDEVAYHQPF